MSMVRTEFNQHTIIEDKARLKRSYQQQMRRTANPKIHGATERVNNTMQPEPNTLSAPSVTTQMPESTFSHTTCQGSSTQSYRDSNGAQRQWKYKHETIMTQSRKDSRVTGVQTTLKIDKFFLNPHMEKLKAAVDRINALAFVNGDTVAAVVKNQDYVAPAMKMNALYITMTTRLAALENSTETQLNHEQVLAVLHACEQDIQEAKADGILAEHHGVMRKTPILSTLMQILDVLSNYFAFLDKKMGKTLSGNASPVFEEAGGFVAGMFKPAKTPTLNELDKYLSDLQWYQKEIQDTFTRVSAFGGA